MKKHYSSTGDYIVYPTVMTDAPVSIQDNGGTDASEEKWFWMPSDSGQWWFWTPEWQTGEREADADLAAGRFETFDTMDEFLVSLK